MTNILFVCLGNICRSPAAEGYMWHLVRQNNAENSIFCDSAGTAAYHSGEAADGRMSEAALRRGYPLDSIARAFNPQSDFERFDLILTMDSNNFDDVSCMDHDDRFKDKIVAFTHFCRIHEVSRVPDPYYGGADGFELVLDIIEDGCQNLFEQIQSGSWKL